MLGFRKKRKEKEFDRVMENLYQFFNKDLPIINIDSYGYINKIWRNVGVVYECTDLIYKKVIKSPIVLYKIKDAKAYKRYQKMTIKDSPQAILTKGQALEEIDNDALSALLANPNPQQDYNSYIGILVLSYLLTGNSYAYNNMSDVTNRPYESWAFPELQINSGGMYNPVKGYTQFADMDIQKEYPADSIYHLKTPNPQFDINGSQLYGVSPLRAYLEPLRTIQEANKQSSMQMKNGGSVVLMTPRDKEDQLNKDQRQSYMDRFKKALKSTASDMRYMTTSIPMDVQKVGLSNGDLELLGIESAREESIYRAYHIPLARYSQKASTMSNQAESNKQLIYDAIAPMCDVIGAMLTNHIGKHFGNTIIELDYLQLPEMAINMKEMVDYIIPLVDSGIISRDDARHAFKYGETGLDYMQAYWYKNQPLEKLYDGTLTANNNNDDKDKNTK